MGYWIEQWTAGNPGSNLGRRRLKGRTGVNFRTFYYWKIFSPRNGSLPDKLEQSLIFLASLDMNFF